ncbi:hydroxymethylglutaryl-CoA reductase, degradative [Flavobacterium agricola]|uniref:3-hydroxy-3-methylglutaryl coenzyme A reductase n=1 Tax=Flavobacterium agricola TaxID=2870839 RepID=A0ABY6LYQ0_9FLAO|nr:hydroxymethylglutaryl-CoA reductase, degradative [Flavobacterium agricola]UYW01321.1 hydroxymethylglutaryl-CoA reductase, degradative [Flavobacterium agricola]
MSINGFSKLSKEEKIEWLATQHFSNPEDGIATLKKYWNSDLQLQNLHDEFIENTISNYYLPIGIAPNFLINGKTYTIPMAIEESSVVAAASKAAKFWAKRGGFTAQVIDTEKIGQVHFNFYGAFNKLELLFDTYKSRFFEDTLHITQNMQKRSGGIIDIQLLNQSHKLPNYYQLHATFNTVDSMGANFINTCLEQFAKTLVALAEQETSFTEEEKNIQIIMSILSNYVPNCLVRAKVSCPVEDLADKKISNPQEYAEKFVNAVKIAEVETYRAVTHNKGIMNGVDAVVIATGNDFRAIEAGAHAYAAKNGMYSSLSHASVENGIFTFWMDIPLALGTVGGLTSLHPMVKIALEILGKPNAKELMEIIAVAGLAQNFAALNSLTTTGIQQGHMKMHLMNILNQFEATETEKKKAIKHFETETVTHAGVVRFLENLRK